MATVQIQIPDTTRSNLSLHHRGRDTNFVILAFTGAVISGGGRIGPCRTDLA